MHHSNAGNLSYVKYADEKHTRYGTHNHEGEGGIMFLGRRKKRTEFEIVETPESATAPAEKDREIKRRTLCQSAVNRRFRGVPSSLPILL